MFTVLFITGAPFIRSVSVSSVMRAVGDLVTDIAPDTIVCAAAGRDLASYAYGYLAGACATMISITPSSYFKGVDFVAEPNTALFSYIRHIINITDPAIPGSPVGSWFTDSGVATAPPLSTICMDKNVEHVRFINLSLTHADTQLKNDYSYALHGLFSEDENIRAQFTGASSMIDKLIPVFAEHGTQLDIESLTLPDLGVVASASATEMVNF